MNALDRELERIVGAEGVIRDPQLRMVYECDGYTLDRAVPERVVLPRSVEECRAVVKLATQNGWSIVPRGAGTGLAGGTLAPPHSMVVAVTRLRAIKELDPVNRQALVEAGVANLAISRAAKPYGLHYAPDPSSQSVSTLGGNIAGNSGGPHTLKTGVTTHHVVALELVTPDGKARWLGSRTPSRGGPDLAGLTVGSEGTLGLVTQAWVRLVPIPPAARTMLAAFPGIDEASRAVSGILRSGIVPAAVELMDRPILEALRAAFQLTFPESAGALLLVEVDGLEEGLDEEAEAVVHTCRSSGAFHIDRATTEADRRRLWTARKKAFGALGRLARNYCTQDGVVPRTKLPEMLRFIAEIGQAAGLRVANVFHAGDGNLHPILLYDERNEREVNAVLEASARILERCLELGGSLTGEHGIGIEKLALMEKSYSAASLESMDRVRRVFDPDRRMNSGKAIPTGGGCFDGRAGLGRVRPGREVPL
ncbi:MAG TPA: FAD-linked oxidase C-terminal domain-containing protein [Candidatus Eisenbacteria bacterium]|nr:FAD-linked oxidase C-terminal domain-containing protein [Candidatus Eisenbacteria bacterium]